jgi:hypothetical protein
VWRGYFYQASSISRTHALKLLSGQSISSKARSFRRLRLELSQSPNHQRRV